MEHYVGIDVSLELSSLCGLGMTIVRVGPEEGPLSQWLYDGPQAVRFEAVLLETRRVKAALSALALKTDCRDARGRAITAHDVMLSLAIAADDRDRDSRRGLQGGGFGPALLCVADRELVKKPSLSLVA